MAEPSDVIRRGIAAINGGDEDGLRAFASPDIVIRDPDRISDVVRGHEAMIDFLAEWKEAFDDYRIETEEILRAPDGRMVMLGTQRGSGKGSGIEISDEINMVMRMEDSLVTELLIFARRKNALEFAGLSSSSAS